VLTFLGVTSGETLNDTEEKDFTLEKRTSDVWNRRQTLSDWFKWLLVFDNVPKVDGEKAG
jgi:hypothetical protein